MDTQIKGRLALVTGTSQGIGEATARASHRDGVEVALLVRDAERHGRIVDDLGDRALAVSGDVTSADRLAAAIEEAEVTLGSIDAPILRDMRARQAGALTMGGR